MIYNLKKLKTLSIATDVKIVSMDIFDTMFIRKIDPPDDVKPIIANKIVSSGILKTSSSEFLTLRDLFEKEIRQENKNLGFDDEASINEIFARILNHFNVDSSIKEKLLDIELFVEKSVITPMPEITSFLENLRKRFKIIAISDTYLTHKMIKKLLDNNGLGSFFDNVYCSCEHRLHKGSGRLFKKVLETESIKESQLLHIGDNFINDYFVPKSMGIKTVLLYEKWNLQRRGLLQKLQRMENKSQFWEGYSFVNRITSTTPPISKSKKEDLCAWGKTVLGPLLTTFIHLFILEIQKNSYEKIYFIAREGFFLRKLYLMFDSTLYNNTLPESCYLSLSRYTCFAASIKDLGEREYAIASAGISTIKDLIARLGFNDLEKVTPVFKRLGIDPLSNLYDENKKDKIINLFNDSEFSEIITKNSSILRSTLSEYLKQLGLFSKTKKIALVDIGWQGTMQECIEHAFTNIQDFSPITGYYLGLMKPLSPYIEKCERKGIIYDYRTSTPEEVAISFLRRDILESSCRAYHGTTIGYKKLKNGRIIPLFKTDSEGRMREKQSNSQIASIQKGMFEFSKEYIKLINIFDIQPHNIKPFITKLYDTSLNFPTQNQAEALENNVNIDDFGLEDIRAVVNETSFKRGFNLKIYLKTLRKTPWREATIRKIGIPGLLLCHFLIKRILCWKRIKLERKK